MTDKTILRVARAVCNSDSKHGYPNWDKLTQSERSHYIRRAKVAVEATEKPVYSHYGVRIK